MGRRRNAVEYTEDLEGSIKWMHKRVRTKGRGAARFGHETGSVYGKGDEEYSGLVWEMEPQDGTEY